MPNINQNHVDAPDFATAVEDARRFTLGRPDVGAGLPVVVAGGWELGSPAYRMVRPGTPVLAIEFLRDGDGSLTLAGRRVRLVPGLVFTYGPGISHRIIPSPGARLSKYFLNLDGPAATAALAAHQLPPGSLRRVADPAPLQAAFDLLIATGRQGGPQAPTVCGHLTMALLGLVAAASAPEDSVDLGGYATFQRACLAMADLHPRVATVEGIAEHLGITPVYLCRLFAQHGQETALQHLTRLRMRRAADLLERGRSAGEVARELGFADQFHFSRCFRRVWGASPRAYLALAAHRPTEDSPA